MQIKSISFENYKAFSKRQTLDLKPITILIGKNSSGKSSIAKLFTLLDNSLSGNIDEPLLLTNYNVVLGGEFRDLSYKRLPNSPITLSVVFNNDTSLTVSVVSDTDDYKLTIFEWAFQSNEKSLVFKYSYGKGYIDELGNIYQCKFKGFKPIEIIDEQGIDITSSINLDFKIDIDYIGPFRILPERQFYLNGQIFFHKTGVKGENAYPILGVSKYMKTPLHENVGNWFKNHFNGWLLEIEDKNKPYIELSLTKDGTSVNIVDVGQGMNQALPLIVRANIDKKDSTIVLEQPELHLHPAAHGELAELFAYSAKSFNQNFIIETHSENFLLRLRKLVVENDFFFNADDIVIYWIEESEKGGQEVLKISIDEDGILSDWPDGVFNENLEEVAEMRKALGRKKIRISCNDIQI